MDKLNGTEFGEFKGKQMQNLMIPAVSKPALVGNRLANEEDIAAVYASDLSRAMDTAKAITSHHQELAITADKRMREIGFGPWEGKYWQEFEGHDAALFKQWRQDVTSVTIPGIEAIDDFAVRVKAFMDDMVAKHPNDKVLVAAHGGSINMFVALAMEMPLKNCWRMQVNNTAIAELRINSDASYLVKINDSNHLD